MALIWVGGAALPDELAARARALGIKLAPCYGSTETAAMVVAQSPERFLNGEEGVGEPLDDIELRVEANGALAVRCRRLAIGRWKPDGDGSLAEQSTEPSVSPLTGVDGWWSSGDAARLKGSAETPQLTLLGRLDGAIHSGGDHGLSRAARGSLDGCCARSWPPSQSSAASWRSRSLNGENVWWF